MIFIKKIYQAWMKVANAVERIATTLILMTLFYVIVSPVAIFRRIFYGTPIPMHPDFKAKTYWVKRSEPHQPKCRFKKRF